MAKPKPIELTTEEIRTTWDYRDGELWWKERKNGRMMDRPAGSFASKYRQIEFNGRLYQMHRLIWLWHDKELVDGLVIDHIDSNRFNNRIENLQQISPGDNVRRSEYVKNPKGGVYFHKVSQKWRAKVCRNYKDIHLGLFQTREEAVECLENYHDEQTRSDSSTSDGAGRETSEALCVN
jgi:hypothetical protein